MTFLRLMVFFLCFGSVQAHLVLESQVELRIAGGQLVGTAETDPSYLLAELGGGVDPLPRDLAWLRSRNPGELHAIEQEIGRYWRERLKLMADGVEIPWNVSVPDFHQALPRFMSEGQPKAPADFVAAIEAKLPPGTRRVEAVWNDPQAMVLMLGVGAGDEARLQPVPSGESALVAERRDEAPEFKAAAPAFGQWVSLGFGHILPEGVDHILFVLGLFLFVPKWKPLLQQTLVFTLAHSLSLAAAALGWVKLPGRPVEVLIAFSIAWIGIENLFVKSFRGRRLVLVGAFGLIHGLGFAGVLAELLPADQPGQLPAALLGFNAGVELGQISVLVMAFPVSLVATLAAGALGCCGPGSHRMRQWEEDFVPLRRIGSILVGLAGVTLVVERACSIKLVPFL